ncbi:sigma-54 dependent transcriptional regulator [Flavobacteriales bacterium]|nr:sigma-54 dependent transcriptional regulator [Flavobacteriales bacterium]
MELQSVKQRFGIIGNSQGLNRALEVAVQVAPTDISVLITGESGTGKETMPQVIHQYSKRKHAEYIAVNCGAIPEGTIDSELFGHEKGSFTGAHEKRKGYFEQADGGTIFLDELGELPLSTQARLLRVLESGEFFKVGSSKVQKTDVRVIAATNAKLEEAIQKGKFREDLYYRLSTVPIKLPPLRERRDDIHLLFRKFASDFAEKYRMPTISLTPDAKEMLVSYNWKGNIRQLKNITEQISVIENRREINSEKLATYLPAVYQNNLPILLPNDGESHSGMSERDILHKVLFDMKKDITELKKIIVDIVQNNGDVNVDFPENDIAIINKMNKDVTENYNEGYSSKPAISYQPQPIQEHEVVEEILSLEEKEKEMITKALDKHRGKRKYAANELGISERTLYRKIKEYGLK